MSSEHSVALVSLGCPKNLVDSQVMLGLLDQAGYRIVEEVEAAEVVIVNTCAFIEPAEAEAVEALLDLAELKTGKCRALICTGCLVQRHGEELLAELPEVDAFLGVGAIPRIVATVAAALAGHRTLVDAPLTYLYDGSSPRILTGPQWLAYLKIADGCNHRCAFCTIPRLRGAYRSVRPEAVAAQLAGLVAGGVREVCLVAQDTSAYGCDLTPRASLKQLLDEMGKIEYDGWLRLLYLHPASLDDETIARVCRGAPLVPYFDIPLQHAAGTVLRAMRRRGDAASHLELIERIRRAQPEAAIRTTFIVGFPGEGDREFDELLEFVTAARLDRLSCFCYFAEAGTPAAELADQVPDELAAERLDELMRVQEELSLETNRRFVGRRLQVLLEGPIADSDLWHGRSYRDAPEVDGEVKVRLPAGCGAVVPGQFIEVQVEAAEVHDLRAAAVVPS